MRLARLSQRGVPGWVRRNSGGGGGAASAYTHYRLYVDAVPTGGDGIGVPALALRRSVGGANLVEVHGGTASASSEYSTSYGADYAFDGSFGTKWFTNAATADEWVQFEFASPQAIPELVIGPDETANRRPKDFRLQASNDGVAWTDVLTVTGKEDWVTNVPEAFTTSLSEAALPSPAPYTYYRLHVRRMQGGVSSARMQELELRESAGGPSVATGGTATADSVFSGTYSADKAFDGNTGTRWISGSGGAPNAFDTPHRWVQYQLPSAATITEYAIIGDDVGDNSPSEWLLLGSDDGSTWDVLDERTGEIGWASGEERVFSNGPEAAPTYLYYRLAIRTNNGRSTAGISEFELFDTAGGSNIATGGTPSASTEFSASFSADKAFDGLEAEFWSTADGDTQVFDSWLQYQLPQAAAVVEYVVQPRYDDGAPKEWKLLGSNDGSTWDVLDHRVNETGWTAQERRTYTVDGFTPSPNAHRYWRLYIAANNGNSLTGTRQLSLRTTVGGDQDAIHPFGTAMKSSEYSGTYAATLAFGANLSGNGWISVSGPPQWVGFDFGENWKQDIVEYGVAISGASSPTAKSAKDFSLEYSDDGTSWTAVDTQTAVTSWAIDELKVYTV